MTKLDDTQAVLFAEGLHKQYADTAALAGVTLRIPRGRIVGLVGRNGSGKTTLLRAFLGLVLPTQGDCRAFGTRCAELGERELARIGAVQQENRFLGWMTARAHLDFVRTFHERWDDARERKLVDALELDLSQRISAMSPGAVQKLALVTAVGHHPDLLLLDEPAASLDPLAREALLETLVELLQEDGATIVISSHVLRDVERVVDWIVCLERGRVVQDAALDDLQETYGEWRVRSRNGGLPARFAEPWVLSQTGAGREALLCVRDADADLEGFRARYHAEVERAPLNLERMFPLWIRERRS